MNVERDFVSGCRVFFLLFHPKRKTIINEDSFITFLRVSEHDKRMCKLCNTYPGTRLFLEHSSGLTDSNRLANTPGWSGQVANQTSWLF